jgi:hypothetical protein
MPTKEQVMADEQLLADMRDVNEAWANPLVYAMCERFEALLRELDGYQAWARSVNEALNSGDGSYRP